MPLPLSTPVQSKTRLTEREPTPVQEEHEPDTSELEHTASGFGGGELGAPLAEDSGSGSDSDSVSGGGGGGESYSADESSDNPFDSMRSAPSAPKQVTAALWMDTMTDGGVCVCTAIAEEG